MDNIKIRAIAEVWHEANRVLQRNKVGSIITVAPAWDEASVDQKEMVITGVINIMSGDVTSPAESHEKWSAWKYAHGWKWGEVKDEQAKTHPLLKPYDAIAIGDRIKDELFFAIVRALEPMPHD